MTWKSAGTTLASMIKLPPYPFQISDYALP